MTLSPISPDKEALTVIQQAVFYLAKWSGVQLPRPEDSQAIAQAKNYLKWSDEPQALRLLFDSVKLSQGQDKQHFWLPKAIDNSNPNIPYPQEEKPSSDDLQALKQQIHKEIKFLENSPNNWQNLSLLILILEKFGSFISFGEADVALVDKARTTAAVASAIANNPDATKLSIVAGDLSGIQKFIYTISSDGALKSLRARSFYLELVTEEVVQQLLSKLNLPRTNVIYAGGGNIYILAPGTDATKDIIKQVRIQFNQWLRKEFQGQVYLALDSSEPFPIADIASEGKFAQHWTDATKQLAAYKSRKFADRIEDLSELLKPYFAHTPCQVCHRDDEENLKPLNDKEPDSVLACGTCRNMFRLGGRLFRVDAIVRSHAKNPGKALHTLAFEFSDQPVYYHLFDYWKQVDLKSDTILLVNDWDIEHYKFKGFRNCVPLLLGNYPQGKIGENPEDTSFMSAGEMAEKARGIKRMGYLRMDVDRLGQIFAKGLSENQTLPRLAGLSRQMSYFFKVYLNTLANNRQDNIPKSTKQLPNKDDTVDKIPRILLFIYAGGDDLFVSGAWNEVVDFGFDVYQSFRAYTGQNPDITLSAGVSINDAKFPLYQAAEESGDAEEIAKGNGRDSLCLFGQVFKWDEWLGIDDIEKNHSDIQDYLKSEAKPNLLGIMPFVERLESQQIGLNYSRNFVRNLLATAQIQEQALKNFVSEEAKKSEEAKGTRYYLHLPKIAYTLARLPREVLKDDDFRKSLKNPYNALYFRAIATWIELLNRVP
ncbi:type III-A CRISPR-associated protein Cas10/Csm1 [Tolypothrix sp. VBCCA 56010]|uniref:type III-A CRISPR-associated protein Cas10/Csm1 n=1 Tax=Tolypothrix sp. VBCCA 56010 TaxID=3137731 RepID=UPI003D7D2F5A